MSLQKEAEIHYFKGSGDWKGVYCGKLKKVKTLRRPWTDKVTDNEELVTCDDCIRSYFGPDEDWRYIEWKISKNVSQL